MAQRFLPARNVRAIAVFGLLLLAAQAVTVSGQVPVNDFFRFPSFGNAEMSPSGRHIAATVKAGTGGRHGLVVFDADDLTKVTAVARYADADISMVRWVNDDRLVFTVIDLQAPVGEQIGGGLFAVDRRGRGEVKNLVRRWFSTDEVGGVVAARGTRVSDSGLSVFHYFKQAVDDGSNDVIVERLDFENNREFKSLAILRLDTVSGAAKPLTHGGPDFARKWVLDQSGNARVAMTIKDNQYALHWRATPEASWVRANEWQTYGETREVWDPLAVDQSGNLYVTSRSGKNTDREVLLRTDMRSATRSWQELMALSDYDFYGELAWGAEGRLLGVRYLTDARGTHWYDASMKAVQADVDRLLPGYVNEISCGRCLNPSRVLVKSWSDRQPVVAQLFDTKARTFQPIAASRPWIKPVTMGRREMLRFKARDGLSIPVHVTHPAGAKGPLPAVVLVHGGPFVRGGEWRWDADSQFLASRGYLVIEPEYRGSTGFGFAHFKAGWKQWGMAMQDDVADAANWAIQRGLADANRICIAGASYGGYAAMMGLVRNRELFKCGINWVGVTDLDLLYTARWSDFSSLWREYGMPVLVGDREADARQFADTSPVKQAARITQPVLMAYGDADRRVPIAHGYALKKAVEAHNRDVEFVTYKEEGHGWILESNTVDFWSRVEKFLQRNIGAPPAAPAK